MPKQTCADNVTAYGSDMWDSYTDKDVETVYQKIIIIPCGYKKAFPPVEQIAMEGLHNE